VGEYAVEVDVALVVLRVAGFLLGVLRIPAVHA